MARENAILGNDCINLSNQAIDGSFCHISGCSVVDPVAHPTAGHFTIGFGTDVSERYVQVTPLRTDYPIITVIQSQTANNVVVYFYDGINPANPIDPDDFYITLF